MKKFILASTTLTTLALVSSNALAYFDICNDTSETIYATYAHYRTNMSTIQKECGSTTLLSGCHYDGWEVQGWWVIAPGQCKRPLGGDIENRYQYVYAETATGDYPAGTTSIKVRQPKFTYNFQLESSGSDCIAQSTFPNPCPPALHTHLHKMIDSGNYKDFVFTIN